jgi:hypothetical protein
MSAGSGASNLGYGNVVPLSNVNGNYVNVSNSNNPANFGSNEISGNPPGPLPGLGGTKSNVDAAAGIYPGGLKGGSATKNLRKKIKNISKKYKKMKGGKHTQKRRLLKIRTLARSLAGGRRKRHSRSHRNRTRSYRRQRGGYSQYQNNLPLTPSYQVAGINLPSNLSALANPAPYTRLSAGANCIDNYNHFTGQGFPSKGH